MPNKRTVIYKGKISRESWRQVARKNCRRKRKYMNIRDAQVQADELMEAGRIRIYTYKCPFCTGYHVSGRQLAKR
jgi:hypothetical protein